MPLASRIHEGVVFAISHQRILLDKFARLFLDLVSHINVPTALIVDAYYASRCERGLFVPGGACELKVRNVSG